MHFPKNCKQSHHQSSFIKIKKKKQFLTIKKDNVPCNGDPSLDRRPQYTQVKHVSKFKPDFTTVSKVKLNFMQLAICIFPHLHFDFTWVH